MKGYSHNQRLWFLGVYSSSCYFILKNGKFCGSETNVHIHHVVPKRYYYDHVGSDPNIPLNGLAVCAYHHIGQGYSDTLKWRETYVPVLHPDIEWARRNYAKNHEIFDVVFKRRETLIKENKTYWNTSFDAVLEDIVNNMIGDYIRHHPERHYPWSKEQKASF